MAKGSKALADLIAADVATSLVKRTWFELLPDDGRQEILAVRERLQSGGYGHAKRLTVARMLFQYCGERGWKVADEKRLALWLKNDS
jgi:hypothetical protein